MTDEIAREEPGEGRNDDDRRVVAADVYERAAERIQLPTPVDELVPLEDLADELAEMKRRRKND